MDELLRSWQSLLTERVKRNLITPEEAKVLYWIVGETLRRMLEAGSKVEPVFRHVVTMIEEAYSSCNFELEDSALAELEAELKSAGAVEPKFKIPAELSIGDYQKRGSEMIRDGSHLALRDPFDVSILELGAGGVDERETATFAFLAKARHELQRMSDSLFDRLPRFLKILGISRCPDTKSVYYNAARMYRTSSESMLHFARTPGILDPADFEEKHRKELFLSMVSSPAPVVYYVCNYDTTIANLRSRIDQDGPTATIDSLSRHLVHFITRKGLEIALADIPEKYFNENRNVSVVSSTDILFSRRRRTRIERAYRIHRTLIGKLLERIPFGSLPNLKPQEMFSWMDQLPKFRSLNEMSQAANSGKRAYEIAAQLVALAGYKKG